MRPRHRGEGTRTDDAKENLGPAESTRSLVPILEHLEHGSHLPTAIYSLVLNDHKLVLRRAVDLDDPMQRIGRVGRDDIEPRPVLIQDKLVERQTRGRDATTTTTTSTTSAHRRPLLLLLLLRRWDGRRRFGPLGRRSRKQIGRQRGGGSNRRSETGTRLGASSRAGASGGDDLTNSTVSISVSLLLVRQGRRRSRGQRSRAGIRGPCGEGGSQRVSGGGDGPRRRRQRGESCGGVPGQLDGTVAHRGSQHPRALVTWTDRHTCRQHVTC